MGDLGSASAMCAWTTKVGSREMPNVVYAFADHAEKREAGRGDVRGERGLSILRSREQQVFSARVARREAKRRCAKRRRDVEGGMNRWALNTNNKRRQRSLDFGREI